MMTWKGKYQYQDSAGPCELTFDAATAAITPAGGNSIAFDLGDVDCVRPGEWDLQLTLYGGQIITLTHFGKSFSDMSRELLEAWHDRTVQCLLLEDLEEIGRYPGSANDTVAEIRLYKSNLAVLPRSGLPLQCRLADVDSLRFNRFAYSIVLESGGDKLELSKLAKKTDEVIGKLTEAIDALHAHSAQALHDVFPFLTADALRKLQEVMPEGRSASLDDLAKIDSRLPDALLAQAVDEPLRPYFDALRAKSSGPLFAGFKFIRPDEEVAEGDAEPSPAEAAPLFFWFFVPLARNLVAWEATTGSGRATYLFRTQGDAAAAVRQLTRGLALINFRREPVYLPDTSLAQQPRYRRYAIGARRLPDLRMLRAAFAGRALHSSIEEWERQFTAIG